MLKKYLNKSTYSDIAHEYKVSSKTINRKVEKALANTPTKFTAHNQIIACLADVICFGNDKLLLATDALTKRFVYAKFVPNETVSVYVDMVSELRRNFVMFAGIVVDGRAGLINSLTVLGLNVQMCHFHMCKLVIRYLTRNPKTVAGKELYHIILTLKYTDNTTFKQSLNNWHTKHKDFLNEKSINPFTKRLHYTHPRLRTAYRAILKHLPYLFTYKQIPGLPNTTNIQDGFVSAIKSKLNIHRGLKSETKKAMIIKLIERNSSTNFVY